MAFASDPVWTRFGTFAQVRTHLLHCVEKPLLEAGREVHSLVPPTTQDDQPVRRPNSVHLFDQQTLGGHLQNVGILETPGSRLVLDGDNHPPGADKLVRPPDEPITGGKQRRHRLRRIVGRQSYFGCQAESGPFAPPQPS